MNVLRRQASQRERESGCRRSVQPLDVVDRNHNRLAVREQLERVADCNCEGPRVHRLIGSIPDQEGSLERAPPWDGQLRQDVAERALEQVAQSGVADPELHLRGPCGEDSEPAFPRGLDAGEPERRLSDSRLALQHDRRHPRRGRSIHEGSKRAQLVVSAQDIHACHLLQRRA